VCFGTGMHSGSGMLAGADDDVLIVMQWLGRPDAAPEFDISCQPGV